MLATGDLNLELSEDEFLSQVVLAYDPEAVESVQLNPAEGEALLHELWDMYVQAAIIGIILSGRVLISRREGEMVIKMKPEAD